jgi:hypothetical protein
MSKKYFSTPRSATSKWYTSTLVVLVLFLVSVLACLVLLVKAALDAEIKTTHLILKSEGCNFLKMNGVATKDAGNNNGCAVVVPFRQNLFGSGGLIILEQQKIRIADDQIVVIGSIEDQPWTQERILTAIGIVISMLAMFGSLVWMVILSN